MVIGYLIFFSAIARIITLFQYTSTFIIKIEIGIQKYDSHYNVMN